MVIEVQWVCSLLSQILGLDNDKHVVEVMLGFLLTFFQSESGLSVCISFDQFIADNIHKQLVNFRSLRHFRYYTYLLKIFLETNKREFPEATFISTECKRITFLIFINKVMSRVYSLIFNTNLPRVLDDMRSYLQPNPENRVGDWVLFMHSTVIWVYGCHESPYLLPIFLTPRVFSLEFIRKRIISETEHFLKFAKPPTSSSLLSLALSLSKPDLVYLRFKQISKSLVFHSYREGDMIHTKSYPREY
jgi:hypothetical protein